MPHCLLEYTQNIQPLPDLHIVFNSIHQSFANSGLVELHKMKSRALPHSLHSMGDGNPDNGFVALTISLMSGRDRSQLQEVGKSCYKILTEAFREVKLQGRLSVTLEIREIDKDLFFS